MTIILNRESKFLRSKSLSCLNIKEFNKVDQTIKNEPFDTKAECSIYSNSKLLMCTEFKNVKSQDQINKFNETQLNQNHFRNGETNIKNEDEIENLNGQNTIIDDETEEANTENYLFPAYAVVALKYFKQETKPRIWCLKMISSPWFERLSMFIIIVNCITLGMYQPCEHLGKKCTSTRCIILEYIDHSIHVFFTVEMMVKIMAMGFYGKKTYLAETWNRLDFFIVIAG